MLYLEDYLDSKHLNPVPETCVRNPTPDSPRVASRRTLSKLYYDKTCEGKAPIRVLDIIKRVESDSSLFMDKVKDLNGEERNEMLKSIDASLRECLKHGEEKVALAIQAFEMVDRHVKRLDEDIARFEEEQLTGPKLIPTSSSWSNRYALVNDRASRFGTEEGRGKRDRTARVTGEKRTNSSGMLRFELAKGKGLAEDVEVDTPQNKPKRIRSDSDNVSVGTPRKERPPRPVPVPATAKPVRTIPVPPVTTIPSVPPATSSANPKSSTEPLSDPNEPTYCLCNQVSFGEMIACDNQYCEIEWFHYTCVGLDGPPKGKWFCPMCQKGSLSPKH